MTDNADFNPPVEPWQLLDKWFAEAKNNEINDFNAMSVATVGTEGMPSVRILLLKDYTKDGFVFFTNRDSRKGMQLAQNAKAALCFHWKSLLRQVRVEGNVIATSDAESDAYFATRPRGSQIGAWASLQSGILDSREALEQRVYTIEKEYEGKSVPRPSHWGGYRVVPTLIELWQNREFRLHDRFVYRRMDATMPWSVERLYP